MLPFRDHNPSHSFPLVTILLIVLNVTVFVYMVLLQISDSELLHTFIKQAAAIPYQLTTGKDLPPPSLQPVYLTIFTAMFMHGGWLHLGGNMLYLWIFGNNIEDNMGSARFLLFYLLCGVIATLVHVASEPFSKIPSLGASGAIAGVLGAYLVRFPRAQVDTCLFFIFITVIRLPAFIVLAGWFLLQFLQGIASLSGASGGGVAFWAHIGGFLAGMVLVLVFPTRSPVKGRYQ